MIRLFVAIALPDEIKDQLLLLPLGIPGANWQRRDQLHLTLAFIGEVDEQTAEDIDMTLAEIVTPAFDLHLEGVGLFGSLREPRHLWAGVAPSEDLMRLQGKIESSLQRAGWISHHRKYKPHVTLARLGKGARAETALSRFLDHHAAFRTGPFEVCEFTLFSSQLSRSGAFYTPEITYPLATSAA